jgi:intracellular sulfur oxidation DsrE/DsrF family protein
MNENNSELKDRRLFLAHAATGITALGAAAMAAGVTPAEAQSAGIDPTWQPSRHAQDDWLDQIPGKHRFIFDTTNPQGVNSALLFATNYFLANRSGYGLQDSDLAVVIVARHASTPFAYNDAIWGRYGTPISAQAENFVDPRTREPAKVNVYGARVEALVKRGVHLAVCQMASRAYAGAIARATGGNTDSIYEEIVQNLLPNSHMVPAGIVAVNRAQERGYTFVHAV